MQQPNIYLKWERGGKTKKYRDKEEERDRQIQYTWKERDTERELKWQMQIQYSTTTKYQHGTRERERYSCGGSGRSLDRIYRGNQAIICNSKLELMEWEILYNWGVPPIFSWGPYTTYVADDFFLGGGRCFWYPST